VAVAGHGSPSAAGTGKRRRDAQRPNSAAGWILRTSAAWTRSPGTVSRFAIAALQTSVLRPNGPAPALGLYRLPAGRRVITDARSLLRGWQARDNAAPAADSIRRT